MALQRDQAVNVSFRPARERQGVARFATERDLFEKQRLTQRHEKFTRFNAADITQPFQIDEKVSYYNPSSKRLSKSQSLAADRAAAQLKAEQQQRQHNYLEFLQRKQQKFHDWVNNHERIAAEAEQRRKMYHANRHSHINQNSLPINPITLEYDSSPAAVQLQYTDNLIRYHAVQRMNHLQQRNNSRYNPVTGAELPQMQLPPKPQLNCARSSSVSASASTVQQAFHT